MRHLKFAQFLPACRVAVPASMMTVRCRNFDQKIGRSPCKMVKDVLWVPRGIDFMEKTGEVRGYLSP